MSAVPTERNEVFFNSSFGVRMTVPRIVEEIRRFMEEGPERRYIVTIGTDSQRLSGGRADFVTAIVVRRVGNGGRYFWRRFDQNNLHTLRDRILREVLISLDAGTEILGMLRNEGMPDFDFEIHADVGQNGPTKAMIQEVVGMIRAYNFEPKMKPESYAASNVADRHV